MSSKALSRPPDVLDLLDTVYQAHGFRVLGGIVQVVGDFRVAEEIYRSLFDEAVSNPPALADLRPAAAGAENAGLEGLIAWLNERAAVLVIEAGFSAPSSPHPSLLESGQQVAAACARLDPPDRQLLLLVFLGLESLEQEADVSADKGRDLAQLKDKLQSLLRVRRRAR